MLFSIVIPIHNTAKYLAECLDSLIAQSYPNWEAICVDDESTDGSGKILDDYSARDSRFKVVHKKNEGVSVARNTALDLATGDWIGFLDSDDVILPDWLQVVHSVAEEMQPDFVRLGFAKWNGSRSYPKPEVLSCRTECVEDISWGWLLFPSKGWAWINFVKRKVIQETGAYFPPGMRLSEDTIFNLQLTVAIKKRSSINYTGYLYRMHDSSTVFSRRSAEDCYRFVNEINELWRRQKDRLPYELLEKCRRSIAKELAHTVVVWNRLRKRECKAEMLKIVDALNACADSGCFSLNDISFLWRAALGVLLSKKSFALLSVENAAFNLIKKLLMELGCHW